MVTKEEILYRVLKYALNNLKPRGVISIPIALRETGLENYVEESDDIFNELDYSGYAKVHRFSARRLGILRVTLDGKYFVENHLRSTDNSNTELIDEAIELSSEYSSINTQLRTARRYLKSTEQSDFRNAVKEAIGAVETTLRIALNDPNITVGEAVKRLSKDSNLHPALAKGISNLYGFNSDSGGIRHGLKEGEFEPNYSDAKFMVMTYTSFINYIIEKYNLTI